MKRFCFHDTVLLAYFEALFNLTWNVSSRLIADVGRFQNF